MREYLMYDFEDMFAAAREKQRRHNMYMSVANEPWRIPVRGGWRYLTKEQYVDDKWTGRIPELSASELRRIINEPGF